MKILVTGGAGFIGSYTIKSLLERGDEVICIDDFNDYYDPQLKEYRIQKFLGEYTFPIYRVDIRDTESLRNIFLTHKIDCICHLAARAGVRSSLLDPVLYAQVNIQGTINILEMARNFGVKKIIISSSSSVYGGNEKLPFSESDRVDTPISPYAATKRTCELIGYNYHHLYQISVVLLRFFTVYGPWGRPDMAYFAFANAIMKEKPIEVYNFGKMKRDFTYISDIVDGILASIDAELNYEIINLGHNSPEDLLEFIHVLEESFGKKVKTILKPLQPGDVVETYADIEKAKKLLKFEPKISIQKGIPQFVEWYRHYYKTNSLQ